MGMRKFEHILRFKPFILRTDSRCMQFLGSLKEVRGIYARWLNFLQGFDFQVVHRPGIKNQNADALSRMEDLGETSEEEDEAEKDRGEDVYNMDMETIEGGLKEDPLGEQKKDPVLREVIKWVEMKKKPDKEESKMLGTEYLAYRVVFEKLKIVPDLGLVYEHPEDQRERFCLPERLFAKAFRMVHSHPSAGHFGISASQRKFRRKFFLPGAGLKIVAAVKNCVNCIQKQRAAPAAAPAGRSRHAPRAAQPDAARNAGSGVWAAGRRHTAGAARCLAYIAQGRSRAAAGSLGAAHGRQPRPPRILRARL